MIRNRSVLCSCRHLPPLSIEVPEKIQQLVKTSLSFPSHQVTLQPSHRSALFRPPHFSDPWAVRSRRRNLAATTFTESHDRWEENARAGMRDESVMDGDRG